MLLLLIECPRNVLVRSSVASPWRGRQNTPTRRGGPASFPGLILDRVRNFNFYPGTRCVSFVCVLYCVVSGGGPEIQLATYFNEACSFEPPQYSDPKSEFPLQGSPCGGSSHPQNVWCGTCGPVVPVVPLTLPEVEGPDAEPQLFGLNSSWYVALYSWEIEEVEPRCRPAGLNRSPYQQAVCW